MKVWFVCCYDQVDPEDLDLGEEYSYDNFVDSKLFATKQLAESHADYLYNQALNEAAENYQRRVKRYQARIDVQSILSSQNPELLQECFPYGFVGDFPQFEMPKKREVYFLNVQE